MSRLLALLLAGSLIHPLTPGSKLPAPSAVLDRGQAAAATSLSALGTTLPVAQVGKLVSDAGHGIVFISTGHLSPSHVVEVVRADGSYDTTIQGFDGWTGAMALDATNNRLYVAEPVADEIAVVNTASTPPTLLSQISTSPMFNTPVDLAVAGGKLWISSCAGFTSAVGAMTLGTTTIHDSGLSPSSGCPRLSADAAGDELLVSPGAYGAEEVFTSFALPLAPAGSLSLAPIPIAVLTSDGASAILVDSSGASEYSMPTFTLEKTLAVPTSFEGYPSTTPQGVADLATGGSIEITTYASLLGVGPNVQSVVSDDLSSGRTVAASVQTIVFGLTLSNDGSTLFYVSTGFTYHASAVFHVADPSKSLPWISPGINLRTPPAAVYGKPFDVHAKSANLFAGDAVHILGTAAGTTRAVGSGAVPASHSTQYTTIATFPWAKRTNLYATYAGSSSANPVAGGPYAVNLDAGLRTKVRGGYGHSGQYTLVHRGKKLVFLVAEAPIAPGETMELTMWFTRGSQWKQVFDQRFRLNKYGVTGFYISGGSAPLGNYRVDCRGPFHSKKSYPGFKQGYFRVTN